MSDNEEEFGGDVLLLDTEDGGEITIKNGLIMADRTFTTASYLSLFGGNESDPGKVDSNKTWWGNRFYGTPENQKMVSRFQHVIKTLPMTSKNLLVAESAARDDLAWIIDEGVADEIDVFLKAVDAGRAELKVVIKKSGELIEKGNWTINWEVASNGI